MKPRELKTVRKRIEELPKRFIEKIEFTDSCWLWKAAITTNGYGKFQAKTRTTVTSHRYIWKHYFGEIPKGLYVLHKCDVRACVNPDHLFLGTAGDNAIDMAAKGRSTLGERNRKAKLTQHQVDEIRRIYKKGGISQSELGRRYGVNQKNISMIVNYETWITPKERKLKYEKPYEA